MSQTAAISPVINHEYCAWPQHYGDECSQLATFQVCNIPYCHYHAEMAYLAILRVLRLEAIERAWSMEQERLESSYV